MNLMIYSFLHATLLVAAILVGIFSELWIGVGVFAVGALLLSKASDNAMQSQFEKAKKIIDIHAKELSIRRNQLTVQMNYGVIDNRKWQNEIDHFMQNVIRPVTGEIDILGKNYNRVRDAINDATGNYQSHGLYKPGATTPVEYEQMVASLLRGRGWETRLTAATGDQGIDVIAEKAGVKLVIQCKLYSKPVGNAAVQEAIAGRSFEQADHAAVVSNIGFTRAAKQLASASNVFLLHHDQLGDLDTVFRGTFSQTQKLIE